MKSCPLQRDLPNLCKLSLMRAWFPFTWEQRRGFGPEIASWLRRALTAISVSETFATPFAVFESGICPDDGNFLHYYFYFVDEELGLFHVPVPASLPCRLQICFDGHNWLAGQLRKRRLSNGRPCVPPHCGLASGRSASPTVGKQNESTRGSTSSRGGAAQSLSLIHI